MNLNLNFYKSKHHTSKNTVTRLFLVTLNQKSIDNEYVRWMLKRGHKKLSLLFSIVQPRNIGNRLLEKFHKSSTNVLVVVGHQSLLYFWLLNGRGVYSHWHCPTKKLLRWFCSQSSMNHAVCWLRKSWFKLRILTFLLCLAWVSRHTGASPNLFVGKNSFIWFNCSIVTGMLASNSVQFFVNVHCVLDQGKYIKHVELCWEFMHYH